MSTICLELYLNKGKIAEGQETLKNINDERGTLTLAKERLEQQELKDLDKQDEKIRLSLEQQDYARKRRENVPTNRDMISDNSSSTSYRSRTETKTLLNLNESSWTRTHKHLVRKRTLNYLAKLAK